MLRIDDVERITRLFHSGAKLKDIAAAVGCARNTARTVLLGEHALQREQPAASEWEWDEDLGEPLAVRVDLSAPVRCPGCRSLVKQLPCVLCASRDVQGLSTTDVIRT